MNYWHIQLHPGEFDGWEAKDILQILKQGFIGCSGDPVYEFNKLKVGDVVLVRHGGTLVALVQVKSPPRDILTSEKSGLVWFDRVAEVDILEEYIDIKVSGEGWYLAKTLMPISKKNEIAYPFISKLYLKLKEGKRMKDITSLLKYKKQIILQGPPGTGKTRLAQLVADEMIKAEVKLTPLQYIDWYIKTFKTTKVINKRNAQRFSLLEDFVSEFPIAKIDDLTLDTYCLGKGSQTTFCYWLEKKMGSLGRFSPGAAGTTVYGVYYSQDQEQYVSTDKSPQEKLFDIKNALNALLTSPNHKKAKEIFRQSFILRILSSYFPADYFPIFNQNHLKLVARIFEIETSDLDDIQINKQINQKFLQMKALHSSQISSYDLMWHLYDKFKIKNNEINLDDTQVLDVIGEKKIIQFHPAFTYEDFVRGIKAETNSNGQVEYKVENKILADFAQKALDNQAINYVLIIDEINRANLPSTLGELIYALEYRYEPTNPNEHIVESMYSLKMNMEDEKGDATLKLPNNLYIIGTMNTADRSVGHIDYAIRRRFSFVDVLPERLENNFETTLFERVSKLFVKDMNADQLEPSDFLSSEFKPKDVWLGHSYFIRKEGVDSNVRLKYEIIPILEEYIKDGVLKDSKELRKAIKEL